MTSTRTETDSFGPLEVPADKYWGAQTQRSIMNFPIGWEKQPVMIIRALGAIKQAAATVNMAQGKLDREIGEAIGDPEVELTAWSNLADVYSNRNDFEADERARRQALAAARELARILDIRQVFATAYHPQGKAALERFHQLSPVLRAAVASDPRLTMDVQ